MQPARRPDVGTPTAGMGKVPNEDDGTDDDADDRQTDEGIAATGVGNVANKDNGTDDDVEAAADNEICEEPDDEAVADDGHDCDNTSTANSADDEETELKIENLSFNVTAEQCELNRNRVVTAQPSQQLKARLDTDLSQTKVFVTVKSNAHVLTV